ncbi:MAG: DNA-processing protein DprA [Lachnospiraceae bacterium]|nr:DNA-processing protein DprA [Lachnospiraceae bacterium]
MENNIIIEEIQQDKAYAYWLHGALERNNRLIDILLEEIGSPKEIYHTESRKVKSYLTQKQFDKYTQITKNWHVELAYERLEHAKIQFMTKQDKDYPMKLREIPDAPFGIYIRGKLPDTNRQSVAIIGARECSAYGRYIARECGMALARSGIQVISGMARGIDGISQKGTVDAGGETYAVLGCGVDICYPESNRELYDKILEQGGILSEYRPGLMPLPRNFPPRNRIISGLSDAVLVIEARERSGTLITVDMALEQGREVYVIPGRITDSLSDGCNRLIRQGAEIVLSIDDFVHEILENGLLYKVHREKGEQMEQMDLTGILVNRVDDPLGRRIVEVLDFTPQPVDTIMEKLYQKQQEKEEPMELCLTEILQQLLQLQIKQIVEQKGGQYCLHL